MPPNSDMEVRELLSNSKIQDINYLAEPSGNTWHN